MVMVLPKFRVLFPERMVTSRLSIAFSVWAALDFLPKMPGFVLDLAKTGHKPVLRIAGLAQTLFKCCYKILV
jgi:hypothetical protein